MALLFWHRTILKIAPAQTDGVVGPQMGQAAKVSRSLPGSQADADQDGWGDIGLVSQEDITIVGRIGLRTERVGADTAWQPDIVVKSIMLIDRKIPDLTA